MEEESKEEDKPQEQEKKEHCWTCTDEFHSRGEVERSRGNFDWKVVEPFDGNLHIWKDYDVNRELYLLLLYSYSLQTS